MDKVERFVRRLVEKYAPEKVVLFGSHAYGEPHEWSDIDLLVVMDTSTHPAMKAAQILSALRPDFPIDLIVRTPETIAQRLAWNDYFLLDIFEKGKVLYESAHA